MSNLNILAFSKWTNRQSELCTISTTIGKGSMGPTWLAYVSQGEARDKFTLTPQHVDEDGSKAKALHDGIATQLQSGVSIEQIHSDIEEEVELLISEDFERKHPPIV